MRTRSKTETVVILALIGIFLVALLPSLLYARREYRDGIRRDEIAQRKIDLEQYFNQNETYPLQYDASPHRYFVVTEDSHGATGWYLRAELENHRDPIIDFDEEAGRNYWYRYVNENQQTYYEVCGGTYECQTPPVEHP